MRLRRRRARPSARRGFPPRPRPARCARAVRRCGRGDGAPRHVAHERLLGEPAVTRPARRGGELVDGAPPARERAVGVGRAADVRGEPASFSSQMMVLYNGSRDSGVCPGL